MPRSLAYALITLPFILAACALMRGETASDITGAGGRTVYVSTRGNDANSGSGPEDGNALRTIHEAVNRLQPGETCVILEGTYRESVVFPRSGSQDRPITIKPLTGQKVIVSGLDPIDGWTPHKDGIWKAPMSWTLGAGRNQVFAGGEVMIEARHPNEPARGLGMYVSDLSPLWPTFGEFSIPDPSGQPGRVVSKLLEGQPDDYWKGACYYGVHYHGWSAQTGIIESSKSGEISVGDRTRTWWFSGPYPGYQPEEGRGMIVGHMNALDRPGEWHWQDGTLYMIPKDGEKPAGVEAKRRQLAFDLSGREHIIIRGISVIGASMRLDESAHCAVDGCAMSYISHFTRFYDIGQIENGRNTITSGETGIFVGGHDNAFLNCGIRFSAGAGFHLRGYHHTIHNCLIDEIDYTSHYLNAITDAVSDFGQYEGRLIGGHVITYNTMRNAGRHFFNFHGNGTSLASRDRAPMDYMAVLFAHNHLYNGMLQTRDAGFLTGYYSSGGTLNGLNSQVAFNAMHDCYDIFGMRINVLGIVYLDAGTCDVDLHHNLLWAAPGSHQRGLWYNTMCVDVHEYDNVFHPQFDRSCAELKPEDFPEKRPFRFGHDFENPPPLPVWPQLEWYKIETRGAAPLRNGEALFMGACDFNREWRTAVMSFASGSPQMNSDKSVRAKPRHGKVSDPLVMEAIACDGRHDAIKEQWTFVYNVPDGGWLCFKQVPLGEGYRRFRAVYGSDNPTPRRIEVRLDAVDGPLAGTLDLPQTDKSRGGRIQIYSEAVGEISPDAKGTRDVFIVFRCDDAKPVGEFEYFRFEQYRGPIHLQKDEVKLELRIDAPDGEKIGEFHPTFTGGPDNFCRFVAKLEAVEGARPIYLSARSALEGPVGRIEWVSFEKAKDPIDWTGIGEPPLMKNGKPILPEATHRPCARPADNYANPHSSSDRPKPMTAITRLAKPPVIDGLLDEWAAVGRAITLKESWDGSESAGPPSEAWIAYDDEAFYIAARHPVKNGGALNMEGHKWGMTDAMEIAFQDGHSAKPGHVLNLYGWPDGHFISSDQAGAPAGAVVNLSKSVTYKAAIGGGAWTCEWRIPFPACEFTPASAPLLRFNLGVRKTAHDAWVIWRGTGAATYLVARAGLAVFPEEMAKQEPPKSGLEAWFDASDAAAIERDAEGRIPAWRDKSGKGWNAKQDSPSLRPYYDAAGLNGRPALIFREKAGTRLELGDISDKKMSGTIFAVFSNPDAGAPENHDPRIFTASDGREHDYMTGICASVPGMETGGPRQGMFGFTDRWAKHARIGCFSPLDQTFFNGAISEILVYSRIMTPQEEERIRAILMARWGLQ